MKSCNFNVSEFKKYFNTQTIKTTTASAEALDQSIITSTAGDTKS